MGRTHRYHCDFGRARSSRARDKAQLTFEDMLIEDFFDDEAGSNGRPARAVPVRYGRQTLADHTAEATVESIVLEGEAPEIAPTVIESPLRQKVPHVTQPVRRGRNGKAIRRESGQFTLRGIVEGFLMGAGVTAAILVLIRIVF